MRRPSEGEHAELIQKEIVCAWKQRLRIAVSPLGQEGKERARFPCLVNLKFLVRIKK